MLNAVNWFEIPVTDFDRALKFYQEITATKMQPMEAMGMKTAFFNFDMQDGAIGGCLMQGPGYTPSKNGAIVYLNGGEDLNTILNKVVAAGGAIALAKMSVGPNGFMAQFIDSEGNRVGLHSKKKNF